MGEATAFRYLGVERAGAVAQVMLRRPEVHNAFNPDLIAELHACFSALGADQALRVIVLSGAGPSFCAGADLNWMRASLDFTHEENIADALRLAQMYETIDTCPQILIGRINGAAMGGGAGLVAVCDIAIAAENARFAFSEAKLGIAPAVISPFVVRKIGETHARALFTTAERFAAQRALAIGLVHRVVPADALESAVDEAVRQALSSGPQAARACKELARLVGTLTPEAAREWTAQTIAQLRTSSEGQEGIRAFLEKRRPAWNVE
jgi:methylglutaconyl-CoA hydratase